MKSHSHWVYIYFLLFIGSLAMISLAAKGWSYYLTPLNQRPFHPDYATMRPSGKFSHGLGILGSLMVIVGVIMYSTRKRVRRLANFGKISWWLEFHIFLCLVGPILIMYHTTFKAGGIAAISLWAMVSVVASGLVGRFLYDLIPHNTRGAELTLQEISSEIDQLASAMMVDPLGVTLIKMMDDAFKSIQRPETMMEVLSTVFRVEQIKLSTRSKIREIINRSHVPDRIAKQLRSASTARASLVQKSMLLNQVQKIFHYWHIIHLPFSIIMGVTLGAHVAVAIMLGYTWIA